ncbi:aminoglycoside N(3)-acetyltransferase [Kitasatospora sp. NPDC054939]
MRTAAPLLTRAELAGRLRHLGVQEGQVLLVQASLRALGEVAGGAEEVVEALLDVLGRGSGTLVVYTSTPENSLTSRLVRTMTAGWSPERIAAWRAGMPAFDPLTTPCSPSMGMLPELVRRRPGALRSSHPQASFAALGVRAEEITRVHDLDCHLGDRSPLARLYELDARVLAIGVDFDKFTGFHLADLRMPGAGRRQYGCVLKAPDGSRRWEYFEGDELDDLHFGRLGKEVLAESAGIVEGRIGDAFTRLVPLREAVDLAERVLRRWKGLPPL